MKNRFLTTLATVALLGPLVAPSVDAQSKRVPYVAYVYIFKEGPSAPYVGAFQQRMTELGWIDGKSVRLDVRDAEGSPDKLNAIMKELVDSKVDVIVTACTPEARVAVKYTKSIPIVMAATGDPVAAGLVTSLAHPGGNVTGVSAMFVELSAKRLALLKEAFPHVNKATILWNPVRPDNTPEVKAMQDAAQALGMQLESQPVRTKAELADALDMLAVSKTQAILNAGDPLIGTEARVIIDHAAKLRLPALYETREFPDRGGLMSFGPSLSSMHRRAADYVNKILHGASPADLPIEQPSRFEFVVNLKTAKALGFTIPQSLLLRADDVIQ
jgi:putative ABC transport system substrate-binding protein